jgi:integrase
MGDERATPSGESDDSGSPQWVLKYTQAGTGDALPPGFPYLIDEKSGDIFQVGLLFMAQEFLTRNLTFVANTVAAYSQDLLDWLRSCTRLEIPWDKATHADLAHYVDSHNFISPHTKQAARQSTVDRRLVPIQQLYAWVAREYPHLCERAPEGTLFKSQNVAQFIDDRRKELRNRPDFGDESTEDVALPNVMQHSQLTAVLKQLGPAPAPITKDSPYDQTTLSCVGHLGAYIACQAGLRVIEVVGLKVKLFEKYVDSTIVPNYLYDIGPFRRKGGKRKRVKFHGVLLQKVVDYIKGEREHVMQTCNANHGYLLVHKQGQFRGKCITKSTLQRRFAKACVSAGIVRAVRKFKFSEDDNTTRISFTEQHAAFVFHDLRHTFAVWTYYARKADGDPEPWKYIQEQLGHEDVTTTIKTYLKVTQDFEAEVSDRFIFSLNALAGVGEMNLDGESDEEEV